MTPDNTGNSGAHAKPLETPVQHVSADWIDYNGHMNMAFYSLAFDRALDSIFDNLGLGEAYMEADQGSCFTMEAHVTYLREVREDAPLRITFQLLDWDEKRLHYIEEMYHDTEGYLAATSEQVCLHVDMKTRRSAPFPSGVVKRLETLWASHKALPRPPQAGRRIDLARKKTAPA